MDRHAVIWSRSGSEPTKMGDLVVTDRETRFSYAERFLDAPDADGFSLLAPPTLYGREPVIFQTRPGFPFPPRLAAFVPGHGRGNIQRRIYERLLSLRSPPPAPGVESDWEIVLLSARNGIGHLDVFRDDLAAEKWYSGQHGTAVSGDRRHAFWHMIREDIAQDLAPMDVALVAQMLGPTPSVGGMIPKILAAIPEGTPWEGGFASSGTRVLDDVACVDVLLKVEPREYEGVVALESLCLDLHSELGFPVPRHWKAEVDGMRLLAVERFDRDAGGSLPMESLFAIFAAGRAAFSGNEGTDWGEVAQWLEKLAMLVKMDVRAVLRDLYRRIILALCTGNGDMHLENVSLLGGSRNVRLAPVYEPAPMRAWPQHDTRSACPRSPFARCAAQTSERKIFFRRVQFIAHGF